MKLFKDKSQSEKIEHVKKMLSEVQDFCREVPIYDAEILDFWDIWVPWLLKEVPEEEGIPIIHGREELETFREKVKRQTIKRVIKILEMSVLKYRHSKQFGKEDAMYEEIKEIKKEFGVTE